MTHYVYIAQSLDGYIAGPNGELDWLENIDNPEQSDFGFSAFMQVVDALLMGKNTFEMVASFGQWPYQKPVFVVSNSLTSLPSGFDGKAQLLKGDPKELVAVLHGQGFNDLYIDGGLLIQSFLKENLVDELIISTIPVLLGEGIPLFGNCSNRINLNLKSSEVLAGQLVKSHYIVDHNPDK
jgi:dihydrofolate reductase